MLEGRSRVYFKRSFELVDELRDPCLFFPTSLPTEQEDLTDRQTDTLAQNTLIADVVAEL